ncbi:MAG: GW dipeptide domain-containing protein [Bacteroidota bacterium]
MILKFRATYILSIVFIIVTACNKGPKDISPLDDKNFEKNTGIFSKETSDYTPIKTNQSLSNEMHKVIIKEIITATKYTYLNVQENDKQFWIATRKQDVNKGGTYYYNGGLLKTNFESKEHNKIFDTIYLVTSLVQEIHGINSPKTDTQISKQNIKEKPTASSEKIIKQEGSITIADLVENSKKYEGKTVQISGKCVKINPNIMGKNWIHIKDGSKDDYDLIITSDKFVKEGTMITIKATVTLNKDFGAGYKYDLILENGIIIP